ncbi:MAG: aminodeoxychorismate lyase [Gammaproteobacteria bacterium]|nr:aminodeoxychorismate lyase [Gammaproteobacteria bacterium]
MKLTGDVSEFDRGLLYGDGVFETMRVVNGGLPLLERHLARLEGSLAVLGVPVPDRPALASALLEAAAEQQEGILKLIVSRGVGGRGYAAPPDVAPTVRVQSFPLPEWPASHTEQGVAVVVSRMRLPTDDPLAGIKTLNRLPQVLAATELEGTGAAEALMRDGQGRIIEGTRSNVFYRIDGIWYTPPVSAGVDGVMRQLLLDEAPVEIGQRHLPDEELAEVDAMFLCNSVFGIWPVARLVDRELASVTMISGFSDVVARRLSGAARE